MKKILVITGSRAEYGLLRSTIDAIQKSEKLELLLLVTGMHTLQCHGMTLHDIERDNLPHVVVAIREDDDMLMSLTKEIQGIRDVVGREHPDLIVVLGDRDEPFAGAIVGGHLNIPVAHIHGGDVTGLVVDEYIRHSITKFSHLHFPASQKSADRILQLGEEPSRVFVVGAPGIDRLRSISFVSKEAVGKRFGLDPKKKWLLAVHHPTPFDPVPFKDQVQPLLTVLEKQGDCERIVILPNSDTGSDVFFREYGAVQGKPGFHVLQNVPHDDYLHLLKYSDALVGNSSSGIIEAGFAHLPVVNIGTRQRGRERGENVIDTGYTEEDISAALTQALSPEFKEICLRGTGPYGNGTAGEEIVRIIEKHIDDPTLRYKKFTYA